MVNRDGLLVQLRQIIAAGGKHFLLMATKTGRWSPLRAGSSGRSRYHMTDVDSPSSGARVADTQKICT